MAELIRRVLARERAAEERERALLGGEAERQATEARGSAETHVVMALRVRLSPVLYCLGKIAAASLGTVEAPLIGSLRGLRSFVSLPAPVLVCSNLDNSTV